MIKDDVYITKYGWMRNKYDLKGVDFDVYAFIYCFTKNIGSFTGRISYIADFFGYERRTVERSLRNLEEKNIIVIEKRKGTSSIYRSVYLEQTYDKKSQGVRQKVASTYDKKSQHINTSSNINTYNRFPQNSYDYEQLEKELLANG